MRTKLASWLQRAPPPPAPGLFQAENAGLWAAYRCDRQPPERGNDPARDDHSPGAASKCPYRAIIRQRVCTLSAKLTAPAAFPGRLRGILAGVPTAAERGLLEVLA
jgi:hypothetical protein